MRVLLDTNVVSEVQRAQGNPAVRERLARFALDDTYLSVLTIGEVAMGIALLPEGRRKREFDQWLTELEAVYADRILTVDREIARLWGEITARGRRTGVVIPALDGLIAATALRHGLHVVTRNRRHIEAAGVLVIDPWADD